MEVVPANNDGSVHLSTVACSSNNSASDRNGSSEWAFLVNVGPCGQTNIKDLLRMQEQSLRIALFSCAIDP